MTDFERAADAFARKISAAGVGYRYDVVLFVLFSTAGGLLQSQVDEAPRRAPAEIIRLLRDLRIVMTSLYENATDVSSRES